MPVNTSMFRCKIDTGVYIVCVCVTVCAKKESETADLTVLVWLKGQSLYQFHGSVFMWGWLCADTECNRV